MRKIRATFYHLTAALGPFQPVNGHVIRSLGTQPRDNSQVLDYDPETKQVVLAASDAHFEIIKGRFKGHGWLWTELVSVPAQIFLSLHQANMAEPNTSARCGQHGVLGTVFFVHYSLSSGQPTPITVEVNTADPEMWRRAAAGLPLGPEPTAFRPDNLQAHVTVNWSVLLQAIPQYGGGTPYTGESIRNSKGDFIATVDSVDLFQHTGLVRLHVNAKDVGWFSSLPRTTPGETLEDDAYTYGVETSTEGEPVEVSKFPARRPPKVGRAERSILL